MTIDAPARARTGPLRYWPDASFAVLVVSAGAVEIDEMGRHGADLVGPWLVVLATATVVGLARTLPGPALAVAWVACLVQLRSGTDIMLVQAAGAWLAFATARWGRLATVWLSALSIPAAAAIGAAYLHEHMLWPRQSHGSAFVRDLYRGTSLPGSTVVPFWLVTAVVIVTLVVLVPWLAGMAVRSLYVAAASRRRQHEAEDVASRAERAAEQAREIVVLRGQQAQLARDVHDVVGHSLAVILAQAESAQYLPDDDPERMRRTMANVAVTARASLRDVRQVLSATDGRSEPAPPDPRGLDGLVDGIRASGNDVRTRVVGEPRPLPPELEMVAFRVLQEMLTNALRHGLRGAPVVVEQRWGDRLRIETRNAVPPPLPADRSDLGAVGTAQGAPDDGMGLTGMRRRLASVGGALDVRTTVDGATFVVTASMPVRSVLHTRPLADGAWLVRATEAS